MIVNMYSKRYIYTYALLKCVYTLYGALKLNFCAQYIQRDDDVYDTFYAPHVVHSSTSSSYIHNTHMLD